MTLCNRVYTSYISTGGNFEWQTAAHGVGGNLIYLMVSYGKYTVGSLGPSLLKCFVMLSVVSLKFTYKLYLLMNQNCLRTKNCLQWYCTNARKMSVGIYICIYIYIYIYIYQLTFCLHSCSDTADNFWLADNFGSSICIVYM